MKVQIPLKYLSNLKIAFTTILANGLRSLLTALGIMFGVAAVITMLAIGKGAKQEILSQIELVGVNNIVIKPVLDSKEEEETGDDEDQGGEEEQKKFSKGLDLSDVESISSIIPSISKTSPEIVMDTYVIGNGIRRSAKLVGIEPSYFSINNIDLVKGSNFSRLQLLNAEPVCIIGKTIQHKFFTGVNPIGEYIKCGEQWLKIIGIIEEKQVSEEAMDNLGIRDYNLDIYTPIKTVLVRYKNRAFIQTGSVQIIRRGFSTIMTSDDGDNNGKPFNYNQIDRLVIQVNESAALQQTAEVVSRMLQRRHNDVVDFEITIPQQLLKQQQKTKDIFNLVLIVIAGISLLVGGIGIMNIMLASVLERTREIGVRLAIGAKKEDIITQFMLEAVLISLTGGIIGIILGVLGAKAIEAFADITTIISGYSILLSFGVASAVGLIFGISPAKKAANQNPIESLRYE